jgi:hypothetical protein
VGALAEKVGRCNDADGILTYDRAGEPKALKTNLRGHARLEVARLPLLGRSMITLPGAARVTATGSCAVADVESAFDHHAQPRPGVRDEIQS